MPMNVVEPGTLHSAAPQRAGPSRLRFDAGVDAPTAEPVRYDRVAMALHWLIGLALLGQVGFGFLLDTIAPRGTPARAPVINLHKSIGIALGLLIVARLAWRFAHRPPAWPAAMGAWQRRAAEHGHRALYACMVVMPLSGYLASNFNRRGIDLFGLALPPWGPPMPPVYSALIGLHDVTAYLFCALVAGHVAVALKHAWVDRDGLFARIWPGPRG
jgi:cytochrome b561